MNTLDKNKLFAKFMEWQYLPNCDTYINRSPTITEVSASKLKFHTSWEWLMPVVEKIEQYGFVSDLSIDYNGNGGEEDKQHTCTIHPAQSNTFAYITGEGSTKIESVYDLCFNYITWFNQKYKK